MTIFSRAARTPPAIETTFADPAAISDALGDVAVPADIAAWLGRLLTLAGVPFGYLVPDEADAAAGVDPLLPPRRELGAGAARRRVQPRAATSPPRPAAPAPTLDRALSRPVPASARAAAPLRPRAAWPRPTRSRSATPPGPASCCAPASSPTTPGLGVNVYPKGSTPDDKDPVAAAGPRLDRLGPHGDTLFCLVHGDAYRVDVHEAPELLHYGIDDYKPQPRGRRRPRRRRSCAPSPARQDGTVTLGADRRPVPIGSGLPRPARRGCCRLTDAGAHVARDGQPEPGRRLDSAQMGFAMTEGVGMVSFSNRDAS